MRIGLVVDSACDLPGRYFRDHAITLLPVTVNIGDDTLTDMRDEQETLQFLHSHIAERGADAETAPFTVQQIQELFLTPSKHATAPSSTRSERSTSMVKSTWPGVSMMLIRCSSPLPSSARQKQVVAAEVIVMPRSCSCSIQSMVAVPSWTSPIL